MFLANVGKMWEIDSILLWKVEIVFMELRCGVVGEVLVNECCFGLSPKRKVSKEPSFLKLFK